MTAWLVIAITECVYSITGADAAGLFLHHTPMASAAEEMSPYNPALYSDNMDMTSDYVNVTLTVNKYRSS
jgi:hypothetical protein